jgi:uncharacterized protein
MAKHTIVHFEIPAHNVERAQHFYGQLFGWQFAVPPGFENYWLIKLEDTGESIGGLLPHREPFRGTLHYIGVSSVEASQAKVERLGGEIMVPKSAVPNTGWFAFCRDTEGNLFALWEDDLSAA